MKADTDVIITGSGLSAYCLALTLKKKQIQSLLIVREQAPVSMENWWETVQSGVYRDLTDFVSQAALESCMVPVEKTLSAWGTTLSEIRTPAPQFHLNKIRLIGRLREKILKEDIPVFPGRVYTRPEYCNHRWKIILEGNDSPGLEITGKILVDATGRAGAIVNKYFTQRKYIDDHIAISKFIRQDNRRHGNVFSIETIADGWWYILTAPDWVQATLITNHSSNPANLYDAFFKYCLEQSYYTKGYLHSNTAAEEPMILDARVGIAWKTSSDYWVSIGEAAYSTDPLGGHGNQICLDQVSQLADAIEVVMGNKNTLRELDYQNQFNFFNHLKTRADYYAMEKRWPQSKFW